MSRRRWGFGLFSCVAAPGKPCVTPEPSNRTDQPPRLVYSGAGSTPSSHGSSADNNDCVFERVASRPHARDQNPRCKMTQPECCRRRGQEVCYQMQQENLDGKVGECFFCICALTLGKPSIAE